jgi:general secretion pathway protein F
LIGTSHFLSQYWWMLLIGILVAMWLVWYLLKDAGRRHVWHQFLLRVPFISWLIVAMDTARFASTLSILTSSGVPLLEGLKIAGEVLTNSRLREASRQVAITVQEGGSLNRALAQTELFPPMLARSALNQERELEMTLGSLMAIMEPAMVILMALVVGFIVIAVLLPIVKMNSLVG